MSEFSLADHQYMALAIKLARKAWYTTSPNPRVGCVLVKGTKIVAQGWHKKAGSGHAEVNALAQAGKLAQGATVYVTLEPCSHFGRTPPCSKALIEAGVAKVICAMVDPNPQVSGRGLAMLEEAGIETASGLLEQEAIALNPGFIQLMTKNLPFVRCKLASSLDGKTAMASGESKWITSAESRQDVQRLRAQSCAIISGADSVIIDKAKMNVRWQELGSLKDRYLAESIRQPVRVLIDSKNRLTPDLPLFSFESRVIIACSTLEKSVKWPHFVEHIEIPNTDSGYIDLHSLLKNLAQRGLNDVLVESGMRLSGAFIEQDLVDQLVLYQAPKIIGNDGKGLAYFNYIHFLANAKNLTISSVSQVGSDIKIVAGFIK